MYKKSALSAAAQLKSLYSTGAMTNSQSSHYERWIKSLEQIKSKSVSTPSANKESRLDVIEQLKHSLNKVGNYSHRNVKPEFKSFYPPVGERNEGIHGFVLSVSSTWESF